MAYELSRHRYLELKHYCLQYPEWKILYSELAAKGLGKGFKQENPTATTAVKLADYKLNIELIEKTAYDADPEFSSYILRSVTEDISFSQLNLPCEKEIFVLFRMKFYWLLSQRKGI